MYSIDSPTSRTDLDKLLHNQDSVRNNLQIGAKTTTIITNSIKELNKRLTRG